MTRQSREADPEGCVTCPLHGLRWHLESGELRPQAQVTGQGRKTLNQAGREDMTRYTMLDGNQGRIVTLNLDGWTRPEHWKGHERYPQGWPNASVQ